MQLTLFVVFVRWKTQNAVSVFFKTICEIEGNKLERAAFVVFGLCQRGDGIQACFVLPNEALSVSSSIAQLARHSAQNLARLWLMHVISHAVASIWHFFRNEVIMIFIIYSKFVISSCLVVTKGRCYCKIFGSCIKNYFAWLTLTA